MTEDRRDNFSKNTHEVPPVYLAANAAMSPAGAQLPTLLWASCTKLKKRPSHLALSLHFLGNRCSGDLLEERS